MRQFINKIPELYEDEYCHINDLREDYIENSNCDWMKSVPQVNTDYILIETMSTYVGKGKKS